jgi:hypothetical protein
MPVDLFSEYYRWTVTAGGTTAPAPGTTETLTVASSTGAPPANNSAATPTQFRIVDAADPNAPPEIMVVTNVSGTAWTTTRGGEGAAPWAHAANWTALPVLTSGALTPMRAPYAPVASTAPAASAPTISAPQGLLWVDTTVTPTTFIGPPGQPDMGVSSASVDLNTYQTAGVYGLTGNITNGPPGLSTGPVTLQVSTVGSGTYILQQLTTVGAPAFGSASGWIFTRSYTAGTWQPWLLPPGPPAPLTVGNGSWQDGNGDWWISANGVNGGAYKRATDVLHARWYRNAALSLAINTLTNVVLDGKTQDDYALYVNSAAAGTWAWMPQVPGWHQFIYQLSVACTASGQLINARMYKNGVQVGHSFAWSTGANANTVTCIFSSNCVVGDYITVTAYLYAALALNVGNTANTWSECHYLGTG